MTSWFRKVEIPPIHTFGPPPAPSTPRGVTLSTGRIVLLLAAVAIVAVLATLTTIGGVVVYAASRPTPTAVAVNRAPVYSAPSYSAPLLVQPVQSNPPMYAWPTAKPIAFPTMAPSQYQQQQDECKKLGYSGAAGFAQPGCRP